MKDATLPMPTGDAESGEGPRETLRPRIVVEGQHVGCPGGAEPPAQRIVPSQPLQGAGERSAVAGPYDETVLAIAYQTPGCRPNPIARYHRQPSIHCLVHHQAPGLAKGCRRDRGQDQNITGGVEVAQFRRLGRSQTQDSSVTPAAWGRLGDVHTGPTRLAADEHERGG